MAKVGLTKLCNNKKVEPKIIKINGIDVSIIQYLPIQEKINLIEKVVAEATSNNLGICNTVKLKIFYILYMIEAYTNINFTDTMLKNVNETYDKIILNNIWEQIVSNIPEEEVNYMWNNILEVAKEMTRFNSSVLGILKTVGDDYANTNLDIQNLLSQLANSQDLGLIKEIAPYLSGNNIE